MGCIKENAGIEELPVFFCLKPMKNKEIYSFSAGKRTQKPVKISKNCLKDRQRKRKLPTKMGWTTYKYGMYFYDQKETTPYNGMNSLQKWDVF